MASIINLNNTNPPAPAGLQNVDWQAPAISSPVIVAVTDNMGVYQIETLNPHGLVTGDSIYIFVEGIQALQGTFTVTVIDPTDFTLNGTVWAAGWMPAVGGSIVAVRPVSAYMVPMVGPANEFSSPPTSPPVDGMSGAVPQPLVSDLDPLAYLDASGKWSIPGAAAVMIGASVSPPHDGVQGEVPAPTEGDAAEGAYLDATGNWSVPPDPVMVGASASPPTSGQAGDVPAPSSADVDLFLRGDGMWASPPDEVMVGASASPPSNGVSGDVPQPLAADADLFLRGDGMWASPPDPVMVGASVSPPTDGQAGDVPAPVSADAVGPLYLDATGEWSVPPPVVMIGASVSPPTDGVAGDVPAPTAADAIGPLYLDATGNWSAPSDEVMIGASASPPVNGQSGDVPAPTSAEVEMFLRGDGTWAAVPTATTSTLGVVEPDGTTITISGGVISATASGQPTAIVCCIDGGGAVPATGLRLTLQIPYACTIVGWSMVADVSGSAQITVNKCASGSYPSTSSIIASAPPALSSSQVIVSTTLTGWTTSISLQDWLDFHLDSVSTITRITLTLFITR